MRRHIPPPRVYFRTYKPGVVGVKIVFPAAWLINCPLQVPPVGAALNTMGALPVHTVSSESGAVRATSCAVNRLKVSRWVWAPHSLVRVASMAYGLAEMGKETGKVLVSTPLILYFAPGTSGLGVYIKT